MTAQQVIDDALKTLRANLANQIDAMTLAQYDATSVAGAKIGTVLNVRKPVRYYEAISMAPKAPWVGPMPTFDPLPAVAHEHLTRLRMEAARLTRIPGPVEVYRDAAGRKWRVVEFNINHRDERVAVLEARIQFIERELNGFDNSAAEYALRRATAKGSRRPRSRPAP